MQAFNGSGKYNKSTRVAFYPIHPKAQVVGQLQLHFEPLSHLPYKLYKSLTMATDLSRIKCSIPGQGLVDARGNQKDQVATCQWNSSWSLTSSDSLTCSCEFKFYLPSSAHCINETYNQRELPKLFKGQEAEIICQKDRRNIKNIIEKLGNELCNSLTQN